MVNRGALVFRGTFTLGWQIWRGLDVYASFGLLSELRFKGTTDPAGATFFSLGLQYRIF